MTTPVDIPPFHISAIFENLYHAPDLLDFSEPGPSSPPSTGASPQPAATSIFSSATSMAAAAGRRAAGIAAGAASPSGTHVTGIRGTLSPDRTGPGDRRSLGLTDQKIEVRCVEGYGKNLYIGRSDGVVEWWVCDDTAGGSKYEGWSLRHQHTLFPRRPVSKIILLPKVLRAFVLSEGTLHPLALPSLETLPSTVIQPLRGVVSVVLDDEELEWGGPGSEDKNAEMTMVVVRRKGLGIYRLGQRLVAQKEIPLPSAPSTLALTSRFLCAALPESATYALIDLSDASLTEVLPISQIDSAVLDFDPNPNVAVIPGDNEFLVTSFTGVGSMGVFLNGQGDPVRGTLEWPDHPLSIAIESGYIIALLRSQVVVIHSLNDMEKPIQVIPVEPGFDAITLSYSPYGIAIRDKIRDVRIATCRLLLLGERLARSDKSTSKGDSLPLDLPETPPAVESPTKEEPESGSGLTPPSSPQPFKRQPITPTRSSSLLQANLPAKGPFSTAIAETLLVGPNGLQAISPTPAILRLEKLCEERRMEEAIAVVDEERRKGRRGEIDGDKVSHQTTLRLLHLYLACHLLLETTFDKAGEYFVRGKVDPRLLVRLFPTLRGKIIGSAEEVEVYEGLRVTLSEMPTIDEIISTSISRNYSPHVSPSTSTAPETVELKRALEYRAKDMLAEVMRKTRQSRRKGGGARGVDSRKIDVVIDTTFAKLLADAGTTNELLALLAGTNDVVLSELEPFLEKRPYVLATVLRQQGKVERVLELLKGIADSVEGDPLCADPVDEVAQQLDGVKDAELFVKYILWLAQRAPDKALSLLLAQNPKTGVKLEDETLVEELRKVDEDLAHRYLEHVVVIKRSPNRALHQHLLDWLLDAAAAEVQDEGVKYHLEELVAEYRLSSDSQPFVVFLADVAPATPIKMLRLKLILFLQGSPFYDLTSAAKRLEEIAPLKTELAIVLGRQGKNKRALRLLARDIGDFVSAQAYCTQGGEIVPPKVAHIVASHVPEVVGWATLGEVGRKRRGTVDAKLQEGLVLDLLSVYMQEGANTSRQAAGLLNAQAVHLDVKDVLSLVPDEWPLDVVSTFFQRGLRRELHAKATSQILKSIAAGQNLQMSEAYLEKVLALPPVLAEGPSPGISLPDEGSIAEKESGPLSLSGEKEMLSAGAMEEKELGGSNGFFSPEIVNKELREIRSAESERREEVDDPR